ncbi:saccharopine dehydrogenase, partial [Fusarium albosuccineum]
MASNHKVLLLGAGFVARPTLEILSEAGIPVTVACRTIDRAKKLAEGVKLASPVSLDATDDQALDAAVAQHDLVISLIPYTFHAAVIKSAIRNKKHVVTTSYVSPAMMELDAEAKEAGITVMNEIGVDPGIDHLYAVKTINEVHKAGGKILSFESYCGGLPAAENSDNPLGYKFSWSSRGVLLALRNAGKWWQDGKVVEVAGYAFVAYPNRDSTPYKERYNIPEAQTIVRGTLRYQGFPQFIRVLVDLGFLEDTPVEALTKPISWQEATKAIIGAASAGAADLKARILSKAKFDSPDEEQRILGGLQWLGLFSEEPITPRGNPLDTLCATLEQKMQYEEGERDMVMLQHKFVIEHQDGRRETRTSTLCENGDPKKYFAMTPVKLVLDGTISDKGILAPLNDSINEPLMRALRENYGIECHEKIIAYTQCDMKPQSAKKQEGQEEREEPSSHANIFKPRTPRGPEKETTKDAYSGQPSNPSTALVDNFGLEDEPSASQNPRNQYPPPPTTTIDGAQSQKALQQNTEISDYLEDSCPEYLRGPSNRAGAPQQDPGQGQIAPSRPPPSLVSSQSRLVASASSQEVASPDSPPSPTPVPLELHLDRDGDFQMRHCSLSLVDSTKHTATSSRVDEPKIIPDIAPSQMFPSVTIIGKTAVSMKPDGNCLFYALADQICQDPNQADNIREAIINFMAGNRDVFKAMLPLNDIHPSQGQEDSFDWDENVRLERYLLLLAKKGVWGGEPEILAAAQHFGVTITVHQENGNFLKYNEYSGDDTVHIRYLRQHNHYYSVKGNDELHLDNSNAAADFESHRSDNNDTTSSHVIEFQPSIEHLIHSELSGMTEDRYHWPAAQSKRLFQMKESGCSWKEIQAAIPHRTLGACQKHWDGVKRMTKEARQAWWE